MCERDRDRNSIRSHKSLPNSGAILLFNIDWITQLMLAPPLIFAQQLGRLIPLLRSSISTS
ncbi:hypothetical protein M431DRAFT_456594 [Trichoderma harzianum CBS 226.95]|uniref:Uncharacterized protein n=1 Tax=Trichoderma harzianum CBS 226.95 TaxID=983964 RepID=A0A2T4A7K9_TRIHA|nr:hypothetical protein M431DRAFT_456594 [Trichoderma harzianum CBS 226.95]PTB53026.1 hypothetical protein M431DRAFT_456594 [Trichoderma harzianum CBS 226.95]